jgi:hypothetical protein
VCVCVDRGLFVYEIPRLRFPQTMDVFANAPLHFRRIPVVRWPKPKD